LFLSFQNIHKKKIQTHTSPLCREAGRLRICEGEGGDGCGSAERGDLLTEGENGGQVRL